MSTVFIILIPCRPRLENFWGERDDLGEHFLAQFPCHRSEDACAFRVVVVGQNYGGVLIEAYIRAVRTPKGLDAAHNDGADDVALFDRCSWNGLFDRANNHVADTGDMPTGTAQD